MCNWKDWKEVSNKMMIKNNANFNHGTPKATTKLKPKPKSNAKPKASLTEVSERFLFATPNTWQVVQFNLRKCLRSITDIFILLPSVMCVLCFVQKEIFLGIFLFSIIKNYYYKIIASYRFIHTIIHSNWVTHKTHKNRYHLLWVWT